MFDNAEDLLRQTPALWENYVTLKIEKDFRLHRFLNEPYPDGKNFYIERIEENISRLRQGVS